MSKFVRDDLPHRCCEIRTEGLFEGIVGRVIGFSLQECKVMERAGICTIITPRSQETGKKYKMILKELGRGGRTTGSRQT